MAQKIRRRTKGKAEVTVGDDDAPLKEVSIPASMWGVDEDGNICIGNDCVSATIEKDGSFVVDINPDAETCSIEMRERLTKTMMSALEGKAKVKFRRRSDTSRFATKKEREAGN